MTDIKQTAMALVRGANATNRRVIAEHLLTLARTATDEDARYVRECFDRVVSADDWQ